MKNPEAQELGRKGGLAGKGKPKKRSPEAQAKITAAAREGTKRYWARIKAEKDHGNL